MTPLYGHDDAVAAFREGLDSGRLHHAWLITGPEGIGKTLFAEKAALYSLARAADPSLESVGLEVPEDHSVTKLFEAGSHPDFVRLERLPARAEDRELPRSEWFGSAELARGIKVDQVRGILRLMGHRPALSPRRVVVVEPADVLEPQAANALLKSLEEPPPGTLFLLVSHAPERLLPTIRSRCRQLRLKPLDAPEMVKALAAALPDAEERELEALAQVGEGAPGRAVAFRGLDIDALDRTLRELAEKGDPTNARRSQLAQSLALKAAQPRYEAFLARVPSLIADRAKSRTGPALADALRLWERAQDLAGGAVRLSLEPQSVVFELAGMVAALADPSPPPASGDRAAGRAAVR